jgi:hypothetical protein
MKKYAIPLFIVFLTAIGCEASLYKFMYNSMDSIIYRSVAEYADPKLDQERFLRQRIEAFVKWHRREELPRYAATLRSLRQRVAAGLKEKDLKWLEQQFERHSVDLFNATSGDMVDFLLSLNPEQIEQMGRKLGERIDRMEKESLADEEKRIRGMERTTVWFMEFIYGTLTDKQKEAIARGVRLVDNIDRVRIRMYRERQAEFIALLKEKPGRAALREYLSRLFINPERSYPEYYRGAADRRDRTIAEGFLKFDRETVTAEQRAHALKKIDMLVQVLAELNRG